MKSRDDFKSEAEYKTYLLFYYSGVAMQSIAAYEAENNQRNQQASGQKAAEKSVIFAQELIKILIPDKR